MVGRLGALVPFKPIASVTPFSYRDNDTYLSILSKMQIGYDGLVDSYNLSTSEHNVIFETLRNGLNEAVIVVNQAADEAEAAADAAAVSASLVGAPADDIIETLVTGASQTRTALDAGYIARLGTRGVTRTIYVRADGNDETGNGKTTGTAFREIKTAVDTLASDGPVLRGSVVIDVGQGTYKGGIRLPQARGRAQDDYVKIIGPSVGGHPNVPLVTIDKAADTTATWGILAEDGSTLWIEDLKFVGAFANAVRVERGVFMQEKNIHIDGQNVGTNGYSIQHRSQYVASGGIVENCTVGVLELFNCNRSSTATSASTGMVVRNCETGVTVKEGGVGHFDYLTVEDCGVGIELNGLCVANMKGVTVKRNDLGIAVINSEIHNAQSVVYGSGVDANTREYVAIGSAASDLTDMNWGGVAEMKTAKYGHRPLITLAADYTDKTVTGVTAETLLYQMPAVIMPHRYNVAGRRLRIVMWGSVVSAPTTATGIRFLLRFGSVLMGEARIPQSAVVGDDFTIEFDVVCDADGNTQKVLGRAGGYPANPFHYSPRAFDTTSQAGPSAPALFVIPGATSESVTMRLCEVWG